MLLRNIANIFHNLHAVHSIFLSGGAIIRSWGAATASHTSSALVSIMTYKYLLETLKCMLYTGIRPESFRLMAYEITGNSGLHR